MRRVTFLRHVVSLLTGRSAVLTLVKALGGFFMLRGLAWLPLGRPSELACPPGCYLLGLFLPPQAVHPP